MSGNAGIGSSHDIKKSGIEAAHCAGPGAKPIAIVSIQGKNDDSQNLTLIASHRDQVPNGYHYQTDFYGGAGSILIQKITVEGMSHAWSGAARVGQYADSKGPKASEMSWLFLSQYSPN